MVCNLATSRNDMSGPKPKRYPFTGFDTESRWTNSTKSLNVLTQQVGQRINSQVMRPTGAGAMVTPMLPQPPPQPLQPLGGRSCPYGPVGRVAVTQPIVAQGLTQDVDMTLADRPDSVTGMTELVAQLTETSGNTFRQLDVMMINLQRQQMDVTQEEHRARQLYTEYQQPLLMMEGNPKLHEKSKKCKLGRATIQDGVT
eukprot:3491397-Amphidinium_carterae.1